MSAEFPSLDRLESQVRALAAAEKPSEVFRLLLESARLSGPRAAVFLLRQTGQGLASHTGTTATARHSGAHRGKAVALVSLGFAAGETALPLLAVLAVAAVGWRAAYGGAALVLAAPLPPALRAQPPPRPSPACRQRFPQALHPDPAVT